VTLTRGRGCSHCRQTGYHGRTGIFEVLHVDDTVRRLISASAPDTSIRQAAVEAGMRTIGEDGLQKVLSGKTTLDEVTRVVYLAETGVKMCPQCNDVLAQEFDYCPSCGEYVGEHCRHCRRRMDPKWTFCPYCGEDDGDATTHASEVPAPEHERRVRSKLKRAS